MTVTSSVPAVEYTPEWQVARRPWYEWSQRAFLAALAHCGVPGTLLDLGCGEGHLVEIAARLGIDSVGVDITLPEEIREERSLVLLRGDLTKPLILHGRGGTTAQTLPRSFECVLCWEVAEHLPAAAADQLVATLAQYTAANGFLLFTAATPGQGGYGHINEQPHQYWIERLLASGFLQCDHKPLRATWAAVCGPCQWYANNLLLFQRRADGTGEA